MWGGLNSFEYVWSHPTSVSDPKGWIGKGAPKGSANPKVAAAAKRGQQKHKEYDYGPGVMKECVLNSGKRMDGYDPSKKIVYELKPNNAKALKRGIKQAKGYCSECDATRGLGHTYEMQTYD